MFAEVVVFHSPSGRLPSSAPFFWKNEMTEEKESPESKEKPIIVSPESKRPIGRPKGSRTAKALAKAGKMITPQQWAEIDVLWESGTVSMEQLMKRFGLSRSGFAKHFSEKGIKHGSAIKEYQDKVKAEVQKAINDDATIVAGRIRETKEDHYKMSSALARLAWEEIIKVRKDGAPMSAATNNLKALDNAINVIKKAREERYACLGLDKDIHTGEGLEELVIHELTSDQIEALRSRDHTEIDGARDKNPISEYDEISDSDDEIVEE